VVIVVGFTITIILISSVAIILNSDDENSVTNAVLFPEDEWPHDELVEWYYWTGHLKTDDERWFGYELVFFIVDMGNQKTKVVNHAVTDVQDESFYYTASLSYGGIPKTGEPLRFEVGDFSAYLQNGRDILHGVVDNLTIDLDLKSMKPPVLHHGNGYIDYPFGGYTFYYSRTHMETNGTITIDDKIYPVNGTSWFDHQWGGLSQVSAIGWDWFAIQLDDGQEIMLFNVHIGEEGFHVGGTWVDSDSNAAEIKPNNFEIVVLDEWVSPHTNKTYPSSWEIHVNDIRLILNPVIEDQELAFRNYNVYWEGACEVSGDATGRAYVELTGY